MSQSYPEDYFLSLPERLIRSAAAIAGGTSLLLTSSLLPGVVEDSTTYKVTFGDMQRFLITRLAQVDSPGSVEMQPVTDDYIYHKMAGNVLEIASLMAVRFSPVWVFAIVSDLAGGSSLYFQRLVKHLKEMEIIDQNASLNNIQELFESIQQASSTSARSIDRPPLSQAELTEIIDDLRGDYGRLAKSSLHLMPQVEKIEDQMETVSEEEDIPLEQLNDVMALRAASLGERGLNTTMAIGKTAGELIDEKIFDSYSQTLDEIAKVGLPKYTADNLTPFLNSAVNHLDPKRETWTERKLAEIRGISVEPKVSE